MTNAPSTTPVPTTRTVLSARRARAFAASAGFALLVATGTALTSAGEAPKPQGPLAGARAEPLRIGMSTALTGPAADLGISMRSGVEMAFAEYGRSLPAGRSPLRLIALDDGYEPDRCAPNMRELTEKEHVLAVVGNVGTPTAIAALPIVNQTETPFFGAYTGAGVLRKDPADPCVINYRASYAEETGAMVDALIDIGHLKPDEVAFFTQRDAYGDSGFSGGIEALRRHGLASVSDVIHARYERNTLAVEGALSEILLGKTQPRAVIMVGSYAPCAEFIKQARALEFTPLFLNVSFVGASSLCKNLGDKGDGVIITQVVPHFDSDLPIVHEYRNALTALDPELVPSFSSLEGYIAGRVFCRAMRSLEGTPTRRAVIDALLSMGKFDMGLGVELELSAKNHQASHRVWPTVIRGGAVVPFEWSSLGPRLPQ